MDGAKNGAIAKCREIPGRDIIEQYTLGSTREGQWGRYVQGRGIQGWEIQERDVQGRDV